ncbi:hypothetical protein AVEN_126726-1 [Araneus ventricosus]|uniref:Uncharacterized protein n=1 Tax=Araneus ventricosus TaxID=182803 RepID=A0A4Y2TQR1_ARAVE|nr:hypothetical protein AVEN_771-1 [Araneus ventricosus]GBO01750.1 hypothetical protein AVEN_126726-1 [Araneus ventricosus]
MCSFPYIFGLKESAFALRLADGDFSSHACISEPTSRLSAAVEFLARLVRKTAPAPDLVQNLIKICNFSNKSVSATWLGAFLNCRIHMRTHVFLFNRFRMNLQFLGENCVLNFVHPF